MTIWKTRSLALAAAVLMAGCATTNYYVEPSGSYAPDNAGYVQPSDNQYADNYADQGDVDADVNFGSFERQLTPYGNWTYHPQWGDVWRPRVAVGFKPYSNGYWANTSEYGWMWVSDDPWGDLTYRYGRWVFDPRDGWMWVPGYVWGPSWVVWRSGGGSIGWFPMPPDDYYGNGPYRGNYASFYGYRDWYGPGFNNDSFFSLWIFVGEDRFADRNYRNYVLPQRDYGRIIVQTNETTNYVTINNYIVNRSINVQNIERASNRRIETVQASTVMRGRSAVVRPVAAGRQIEQRERRERPIPANANANANANGVDRNRRPDANDARPPVRARDDARDAREAAREDNGPNGRGRQNEQIDRNPRGNPPQNARAPQNDNQAERLDRRDERLENRGRVQAPQNANAPQQNGNVERAVERPVRERPDNNPRQNAQSDRAAERAAVRGGNNQGAVQPAGARPAEAAPVPAGGGAAARQQRQEEREAKSEDTPERAAERAAERRRNAR